MSSELIIDEFSGEDVSETPGALRAANQIRMHEEYSDPELRREMRHNNDKENIYRSDGRRERNTLSYAGVITALKVVSEVGLVKMKVRCRVGHGDKETLLIIHRADVFPVARVRVGQLVSGTGGWRIIRTDGKAYIVLEEPSVFLERAQKQDVPITSPRTSQICDGRQSK